MQILKNNPNTAFVSESMIRFSNEFKNELLTRTDQGESPKTVFRDAGYDLDLLGEHRVYNTLHKLNKQRAESLENAVDQEQYKRVCSELKSMRSELDALKKIIKLTNSRRSID